jgi:tRNA modification GTPase
MSGPLDVDTIAAVATAPGRGGVGIVRISGPAAERIGEQLCQISFDSRHAHYTTFHDRPDAAPLDHGIALYFPAPYSMTGEDVVELQAHGGMVVLDLLLKACCSLGARLARPGEFTERAFLNDKLDLAQAEAVADLIESTTEDAARSATRSLMGEFSRAVNALVADITRLRVYVEASIDFPEEEIDFLADGQVAEQLDSIIDRPNAGKSSLLNALSGQDTAIVTPIEGTTRDVLRENIQVDGMPLHVVDTAGLRDSSDAIEQEGIRRAWQEIATADRVLLVIDGSETSSPTGGLSLQALWPELQEHLEAPLPVTIVRNKSDLAGQPAGLDDSGETAVLTLSAKTGDGLELLRQHLLSSMGYRGTEAGQFSARRRHLEALDRALLCLESGRDQLRAAAAGELLAEDLRQAQACLGEITGAVTPDDLLGQIFGSFCIGK